MEAVVAPDSAEHQRQSLSVSPYTSKQVRTVRSPRNRAHRSVNLASVPGPSESFVSLANSFHGGLLNPQKQPPLLPLPVTPKAHVSSYPPPGSAKPKPQRLARHHSLNPSKPLIRRQGSAVIISRGSELMPAARPLGPEPYELPKNISVSMVPNPSAPLQLPEPGRFSGSVFELAPPPSSLPLPRFSLRPKLRCNAEAGVDSGATDSLRQILRLR
ncbi:increased rDNA silencing protein 4 [Punica granatum]|uniref:Uncharacterized protein n=2 Tax=Punica granatum TaxID=22663 RepID=A0A2I0INR1_PUNGR|nr:increased rDNA silencing protein 4 [Punica granatum]PKI45644.1 hypothetical protein CRG98_033960 [Punica granatum]